MRPATALFLTAVLSSLTAGCGTVHNLKAPPSHPWQEGEFPEVPNDCTPFGGVKRSAMLGAYGPVAGIHGMIQGTEFLGGAVMAGYGVLAIADVPLSLVGDVVTFPVARARSRGETWATWWGDQWPPPKEDIERFWMIDTPNHITPDRLPENGESKRDIPAEDGKP